MPDRSFFTVAGGSLSADGRSTSTFGGAITLTLTNSGKSVAHFVRVEATLVFSGMIDLQLNSTKNLLPKICAELKRGGSEPKGASLFPTQSLDEPVLALDDDATTRAWQAYAARVAKSRNVTSSSDLEEHPEWAYPDPESFYIVGCVDYTFGGVDDRHHQTPFVYSLQRTDGEEIKPDRDGNPNGRRSADSRGQWRRRRGLRPARLTVDLSGARSGH